MALLLRDMGCKPGTMARSGPPSRRGDLDVACGTDAGGPISARFRPRSPWRGIWSALLSSLAHPAPHPTSLTEATPRLGPDGMEAVNRPLGGGRRR